jgi:cobalt-zinc-cadmium resistance protein CzcA
VLIIFMILFALYGNFKFPVTIALGVLLTEPVGALMALKLTGTPFSVSSALGMLALMGVSVETAVILVSYINKLRMEKHGHPDGDARGFAAAAAAHHDDGAGGLPGTAAGGAFDGYRFGHAKPFAIVIVAG